MLFVCFVMARRIVYSPFGLSLRALKGNPLRAAAIGIPVKWRLVAIYTVSAGFAGIAGALLTQTTAFCSLDVLSLDGRPICCSSSSSAAPAISMAA